MNPGNPQNQTPPSTEPAPKMITWLIALSLLAWGVFHAVGAYYYNHNIWRGVVVLVCVGLFLGFWFLMLRLRPPRRSP